MKQAILQKINFLKKMTIDTLKKGVFFIKKNINFFKNFYKNANFNTLNRYNTYCIIFKFLIVNLKMKEI